MGGTGSGPQLTLPDKILRSKLTIAALYPDALQAIKEAVHPPTPLELRFQAGKWLAEMHDGKPRQDVRGSGLAPVTINVIAPSDAAQGLTRRILRGEGITTVDAQYRELGPAVDMPQDAPGEARDGFEGREANSELTRGGQATPPPALPVSLFKGISSPGTPSPTSPSEANLYGFEDCKKPIHKPTSKAKAKLPRTLPDDYSANLERNPALAEGPGAAPNSKEARYAQRQAQLRALEEQQGSQ